jgi:hypothetical protein
LPSIAAATWRCFPGRRRRREDQPVLRHPQSGRTPRAGGIKSDQPVGAGLVTEPLPCRSPPPMRSSDAVHRGAADVTRLGHRQRDLLARARCLRIRSARSGGSSGANGLRAFMRSRIMKPGPPRAKATSRPCGRRTSRCPVLHAGSAHRSARELVPAGRLDDGLI